MNKLLDLLATVFILAFIVAVTWSFTRTEPVELGANCTLRSGTSTADCISNTGEKFEVVVYRRYEPPEVTYGSKAHLCK